MNILCMKVDPACAVSSSILYFFMIYHMFEVNTYALRCDVQECIVFCLCCLYPEHHLHKSYDTVCFTLYQFIAGKNIYSFLFQECCYPLNSRGRVRGSRTNAIPMAGTLLESSPFFRTRQYFQNDFNPKEACCNTGHCDWYYEVRPRTRCYRRARFRPGMHANASFFRFFFLVLTPCTDVSFIYLSNTSFRRYFF